MRKLTVYIWIFIIIFMGYLVLLNVMANDQLQRVTEDITNSAKNIWLVSTVAESCGVTSLAHKGSPKSASQSAEIPSGSQKLRCGDCVSLIGILVKSANHIHIREMGSERRT